MGTRSLTVFKDEDGEEVAVMYRHWDGYPAGHGLELAAFLYPAQGTMGAVRSSKRTYNGASCLIAAIISHFKTEAGNVYLYPAGTRNMGDEYLYTVSVNGDGLVIEAFKVPFNGRDNRLLFSGPVPEFLHWCLPRHRMLGGYTMDDRPRCYCGGRCHP